MNSKKILIVDDDEDLLEELHAALTSEGYNVVVIEDSIEALKAALIINPDVILLDIKMKGLYGFQIAERLKRSPKTANIPILAMSGYFTRREDLRLMNMCGMKMCLKKPIDPECLIGMIDMVLKGKTNNMEGLG